MKFSPLQRIKNSLRSYEEAHLDDNSVPKFQPNPADVRKLIESYETLEKAVSTAMGHVTDYGQLETGTTQSRDLIQAWGASKAVEVA